MSEKYYCPQCGGKVSFGEIICPHCKADVTSMWEQASGAPKKEQPKLIPGTGGMDKGKSPFPPAKGLPFPPAGGFPFPPAKGSPFPPAGGYHFPLLRK